MANSAHDNLSFVNRWGKLGASASEARASQAMLVFSIMLAVIYNILGILDIVSTMAGLQSQNGVEANPFIRMLMENFSNGWIPAKLALQSLVTAMILWFPHKIVLSVFSLTMMMTSYVVFNNFQIAGIL